MFSVGGGANTWLLVLSVSPLVTSEEEFADTPIAFLEGINEAEKK